MTAFAALNVQDALTSNVQGYRKIGNGHKTLDCGQHGLQCCDSTRKTGAASKKAVLCLQLRKADRLYYIGSRENALNVLRMVKKT